MKHKPICIIAILMCHAFAHGQPGPGQYVNVFLGSSGDHGQLSPAASAPFGMLSIGPQTYPHGHTGYEYRATKYLGFTHNRFEGVGCEGSGGNILVTPVSKQSPELKKVKQEGHPGYYSASFTNGVTASFAVAGRSGVEKYHFPSNDNGFIIDLSHTLANSFYNEQHTITNNTLSGWIVSGTTCDMGRYKIYYSISFDQGARDSDSATHLVKVTTNSKDVFLRIALSSVDEEHAKSSITTNTFDQQRTLAEKEWNDALGHISVSGDRQEQKLFYSLLYRTMQSPYVITEPDGAYRTTNGALDHSGRTIYNGWSVWDNYKTQLPLLSVMNPERYGDIIGSVVGLYRYGKKSWATLTEPTNSVRTEHAIVVLLDAYRKGYALGFNQILDSLLRETDSLKFNRPDKALESCYDAWAMSQILHIVHKDSLSAVYLQKAASWKNYWNKDFKDITKTDVDELPARGMYQGTIWQYRWMVPYDIKGLMEACGGEQQYINQLDTFFTNDYYNAANEPDIQVPYLYNGTSQPWKSQRIIHHYAQDTVVQYYYNDNSRGIDPFIDRIYKNRPDAYVRTMDDDGGAMSSWYVLAACGLSPACVGWPVWYLHMPLFRKVVFNKLAITVTGAGKYIYSAELNGKALDRNWLTQQEIVSGGRLHITASDQPNKRFGVGNLWQSAIDRKK